MKLNYVLIILLSSVILPNLLLIGVANAQSENWVESALSTAPGGQSSPAIYEEFVVYSDHRNDYWDIYMYNLNTRQESRVTDEPFNQFGPDISGDLIVYTAMVGEEYWVYARNITIDIQYLLTTTGSDPAIYNDKVVWVDTRNDMGDIFMYDFSSSFETQITSDPHYQYTPDIYGNYIAWADYRGVHIYDIEKGNEIATMDGFHPSIYDDKVTYTVDTTHDIDHDIYLYDIASVRAVCLVDTPSIAQLSQIHGSWVVWQQSDQGFFGTFNVYAIDINTKRIYQVNSHVWGNAYLPTVFKNRVLWTDTRNGAADIYMAEWRSWSFAELVQVVVFSSVQRVLPLVFAMVPLILVLPPFYPEDICQKFPELCPEPIPFPWKHRRILISLGSLIMLASFVAPYLVPLTMNQSILGLAYGAGFMLSYLGLAQISKVYRDIFRRNR